MKNARRKFAGGKIAAAHVGAKLRRARRSIILPVRRSSPLGRFFRLRRFLPVPRTADNLEFYGEVRKATRLAALGGASGRCLTFLRNSLPPPPTPPPPPSALTHPVDVFSPSLPADIMLTSLPTLDISSCSSLSLIYEALFAVSFCPPLVLAPSPSPPLSFSHSSPPSRSFSLTSSLVNASESRNCNSRRETPSNCQNVKTHPRSLGIVGTERDFVPFRGELSFAKPIPADNLFLSGLQSTRAPHEWDSG